MSRVMVDCDALTATYNQRFAPQHDLTELAGTLVALAERAKAHKILEVGCGAIRWLAALRSISDPSSNKSI